MSIRRSLFVLTLVTLILPLAVFAQRANQPAASLTIESENIQLYTIEKGDVAVVVNAIGAVEANQVVQMNFVNPGRVREVLVEEGDYVLAGDVLVAQVDDTQRIAYEQALLALDLAQLDLADLLQPVDEEDIRIAEANVRSAWGAVQSIENAVSNDDLRAASLRIEQAQEAYDEAVRRRTTAQGGQGDEAYALLDAQVGQASFNLEIARREYNSLQTMNRGQQGAAYARALQAARELERVKAGPTQYQIDLAEVAVAQAQIQLDAAANDYNRMTLVAPFDGIVSRVYIEVGSLAAPGLPVLELTNISPLHVMTEVDEVDIRRITEGMSARIQLDALPNTSLSGVIERIAVLGQDQNGIVSYDVKFRVNDVDPRVRDGMTAEAAVIVEEQRDVLAVPNQYIRLDRRTDQAFVNVAQSDGTLKEVEIKLGLRGENNSEVVAGLQTGDVVALDLTSSRFSLFGG
jgi:HlyD family secretion protein